MTAWTIFKYLPDQYADALLDGNILFRNLVYFKRIENDPRLDVYEGLHSSETDSDYTLQRVYPTEGPPHKGRWPIQYYLHNAEKVFCFCTSMRLDTSLAKFGASCIEIFDPNEFNRRIEKSLRPRERMHRLDKPILLAQPVVYYEPKGQLPNELNREDPRHLPFLKRSEYSGENEFRSVFAKKGGYKLMTRLISMNYNYADDIRDKQDDQMVIRIGSIRDIARTVSL
jgi:hypothetical protein